MAKVVQAKQDELAALAEQVLSVVRDEHSTDQARARLHRPAAGVARPHRAGLGHPALPGPAQPGGGGGPGPHGPGSADGHADLQRPRGCLGLGRRNGLRLLRPGLGPGRVPGAGRGAGGSRFNDDAGRQAYHDREHDLLESTPFVGGLDHGELLARLAQFNRRLGWDHDTTVQLPLAGLGGAEARGALWSALYGGSHAVLEPGPVPGWDPGVFRGLLD